jgi:hypothetical protein
MRKQGPPWASGPGEILKHGLDLLRKDTDTNRRLAMISIDNAVELMIKTYLGLPKRVTGLTISRKEFQEISESFPSLLDALETHAAAKLRGIDLGEIEWYHRLRNQLYHQGNGLTVERDKIEIYAELANTLFENLFGQKLIPQVTVASELGEFMEAWVEFEHGLRDLAATNSLTGTPRRGLIDTIHFVRGIGILTPEEIREIESLRKLRNEVVHGQVDFKAALTPAIIEKVKNYAARFREDEQSVGF